ncbi:hypothetical protein POTOM_024677 [Populus tomentosa]|uniref:EXS domain-containing protein n=1 Tax=Populus tomentosa TaxID=118781 RepID=A0A8X7ZJP7_POPTO|nr:hypothetical protein POTOM_024677 [Populus tomentosa]
MLMYAANIYFWRRYRINYSFIFGFKQGTELGYREVLLLDFGLAVLSFASVLANLDMEIDPKTNDYQALTELVPLSLFVVSFQDSFLADQLTSQVYPHRDYKRRQNNCKTNDVYDTFYFIVAVIPFWSRLLQVCNLNLLRYQELFKISNCFKGLLLLKTAYSLNKGLGWKIFASVSSVIAALYGTYGDLVMDWGLLQSLSKNWLLRDKLLIPYRSVYFVAMVLNVLLRFAWLRTVLNFRLPFLHRQSLIAIVASLEIIRRGIWNFFRLENEHLHNVGKYLAFKAVPLPFEYSMRQEKHELISAWDQLKRFPVVSSRVLVSSLVAKRGSLSHKTPRRADQDYCFLLARYLGLENEYLNNVGKYREFKSVPIPFDYNAGEARHDLIIESEQNQ